MAAAQQVQNTSCQLYAGTHVEPVLECGDDSGLICLKTISYWYLGAVGFIPLVVAIAICWSFHDDPIGLNHAWVRDAWPKLRVILNGPRYAVAAVLFIIGFGRICDKYNYADPCRNDDFNKSRDIQLFFSLFINAFIYPVAKAAYEVSFVVRRTTGEISFSPAEVWRRRLIHPIADIHVWITPWLGALLFPEGRQESEAQGRTCLRGWGCETGAWIGLVSGGSIFFLCLAGIIGVFYFRTEESDELRLKIQWGLIALFPFWLAWYIAVVAIILNRKTDAYKELNMFADFTLTDVSDIRNYNFIPAVTVANILLDLPVFLVLYVMYISSLPPDRTYSGRQGGRNLGIPRPHLARPNMYNNPSTVAKERGGLISSASPNFGRSVPMGPSAKRVNKKLFDRLPSEVALSPNRNLSRFPSPVRGASTKVQPFEV